MRLKRIKKFILCLIAFASFSYLLTSKSTFAETPEVWECMPSSCSVPNQTQPRAKNYEISDFEKLEKKKQKLFANEAKKYPNYAKKSERELGLQKRSRGQFGVWSFPTAGN